MNMIAEFTPPAVRKLIIARDLATNKPLSKDNLRERTRLIAKDLQKELAGQDVTAVPVMTGAFFFAAKLIQFLANEGKPVLKSMMLRPVWATSYKGTESHAIAFEPCGLDRTHIEDRHVLLIDDILDSGRTLCHVQGFLEHLGASRVTTVTMLRKAGCQREEFRLKDGPLHIGFEIGNSFVVGFGLDLDQMYRELSNICEVVFEDGHHGKPKPRRQRPRQPK